MTDAVTLFEMGPRDGLQNERRSISTAEKVRLVDLLSATGLRKIEAASFVSPRWVPQMADAAEVMAGITRAPGVAYTALTPNMCGLEGALASGATEVAVFASASEGFSRANINCSIDQSLERFVPVIVGALAAGVVVRGYVSCVVDCPYDGSVAPGAVLDVTERLLALGCYEVSLGDTLGLGTPAAVHALLRRLADSVPPARLAGHFHDTGGNAIANIEVALEQGLRTFDSSVGGLGGCPYAPGAKGNVATEKVNERLRQLGMETGLDAERLSDAAAFAKTLGSAN
ncbi:hydroxymethylglutaryl-CoA lyase [Aureimonas sp. ME7]|uniref:hydroxymethylglutaryl-CoA lyase n=1 Tax=Aureimonas sp. ME7 TaxID=2744252 RepID=UPI0015F52728|nr:hydroxymethylglutaryl-CoA lyase [Aureimonas sp. ME7]